MVAASSASFMHRTIPDRVWRYRRHDRGWEVIIRDTVGDRTVHTLGTVTRDEVTGWWRCNGPDGYVSGGFRYRADAAQCLFDDWNTAPFASEVIARVKANRS
jgi:hypothetical protein